MLVAEKLGFYSCAMPADDPIDDMVIKESSYCRILIGVCKHVFVSALFTRKPDSSTTKVVEFIVTGKITPLYNSEIMAEYQEVLSREHFHITENERNILFNHIRKKGIAVERVSVDTLFIDESDRVFYEVALSKEDSFLVTGNLKHFPIDPRVVTPAQMLQILGEE